jgi:SRSO17 transposase
MSQSPWSGAAVCHQVRQELKATVELTAGGVRLVDESADEKAGEHSAGAGRQYHGRLGKVEMSQVGVLLGYANLKVAPGVWSGVDGELFRPREWFSEERKQVRERLGIPKERGFQGKAELAWTMIKRAMDEHSWRLSA